MDLRQFQNILHNNNDVLAVISTSACSGCVKVHKMLSKLKSRLPTHIITINLSSENQTYEQEEFEERVLQQWQIRSLPTFVHFVNGNIVNKWVPTEFDNKQQFTQELLTQLNQ